MVVSYPVVDPIDIGGSVPPSSGGVVYDPVTYQPITTTNYYGSGPIFTFKSVIGRYPGNNKQWWVAKAITDDPTKGVTQGQFLPKLLETFYDGNNRAPRGHFILDQFKKDRASVSGIAELPSAEVGERPNSVAFFSGRAWFACKSTVYYSQILDSTSASKAGLCYQEADPTAESISDLIDSDGGVIPIPEADHIEALRPLLNGLMIFAQNGVWFVSGSDAAFSARNIAVAKISPIGTTSPRSIVETDNVLFWWSHVGIQAIQQRQGSFGPINGRFDNTNIAEQTIQTFYNNIGNTSKKNVKSILDTQNNLIYWLYSSTESSLYEYDSVLVYDITLQAFYPWKFSSITAGPRINGLFLDSGYLSSGFSENIQDGGVDVTDSGTVLSATRTDSSVKPSGVYYLTQVPGYGVTVSAPVSFDYVDWKAFNNVGAIYDSYILTGYEVLNDTMRNKQAVYVFVHFRRTEDNLGNLPSSCNMITKWDWAGDGNTRKWSQSVEAYRPRTIQLTDVVVSKNKVRGSGKSIQFRFGTNEPGKTFDLLGWAVEYSGVTEP